MFNGKTDQIAYIAYNDEDEKSIKKALGLENAVWVEDECVASGIVRGVPGVNKAKLLFNYDMGIEVEILRYIEGPNYADGIVGGSIGHIGIHAGPGENVPTFNFPIIQQVKTRSHTNEFLLKTGRKYQYTIYDTFDALGVYMKVIERIEA
jgi:hypothetical protein